MKIVFVFALFVAAVFAAGDQDATIVSDTQDVRVDGYNFQ
jgi:hypothetical protein